MADGGSDVLVVGLEERVVLDGLLGDEHSDGGEHGDASLRSVGGTWLCS